MNPNNFEVMIVGAGPAGSLAAERLAARGVRVALFDGRPAHQPKACGGGVTSKALKAWPFLREACGRVVTDLELYSPAGRRLCMELDEPFEIYSRAALDSYMRERARSAGATVIEAKVSLQQAAAGAGDWVLSSGTSSGSWSAATLVVADGANSRIAKQLAGPISNADMEVAFGYRAPLPQVAQPATVVAFLPRWSGYAWAFPRLDHVSFGIATAQDTFAHEALDQMLWSFMVNYYQSGKRVRNDGGMWRIGADEPSSGIHAQLRSTAERYAARIPGLAPASWDARTTCAHNWALLGDAAGFADPVTGEGIYYALRSAELFAQAHANGNLLEFEQLWRTDFGADLRRAARMRKRFYGQFLGAAFTDRMVQFAGVHPGIRRVLRDLVAGDQDYVSLKRTLAKRAFLPFTHTRA